VAYTDFEGGGDDHGYGDCIFLVIYAQPSHIQINPDRSHSKIKSKHENFQQQKPTWPAALIGPRDWTFLWQLRREEAITMQ
jgi:hypothetical protein